MKQTTPHTPTPWHIANPAKLCPKIWPCASFAGRNGGMLGTVAERGPKGEANADFIVKAVNNHDALVGALESLMENFVGDRTSFNCHGEGGLAADRARNILFNLQS